MAKPKREEWMSVVEAAKRLGVTRETIYQAIEAGRLKGRLTTVTRKVWRIDPSSLSGFEVSPASQRAGKRAARLRYARRKR